MTRDPAIHILKSDLFRIFMEIQDWPEGAQDMTDTVFRHAKKYQIRTRSIVAGNATQRKRVERRSTAVCPLTPERLGRILYAERVRHQHQVITAINKGDSAWTTLMEVARDAYEFGELFGIMPRDEAYRQYVDLGLQLMGRKYAIGKFKYHKERIFERKGSHVLIADDPDTEGTDRFQRIWRKAMERHSRMAMKLDPLDRVHFIYARIEAEQEGAKFSVWIEAQFERLAFLSAVPNLNQFYGDGALKRYREHALKGSHKKAGEVSHELPTESTGDEATDAYYAMLLKLKNAGE